MASLLHGSSTPAGISCGRPHCVILLPGRAVAERKYHYPCRDLRETVCHRLFYDQTIPLAIFAVILFQRAPARMSHGVSTDVAFPMFEKRQLTYLGCWILSCQRTRGQKKKALTSNVGSEVLYQKFLSSFFDILFPNRKFPAIAPLYLCSFRGTLHGIFFKIFFSFYFQKKIPLTYSHGKQGG